ncbi:TonB family protein [Pontibacter sp. H249]|uniref:TonB family protein n=1 Tax=Pontibacter sp. H249 TaxID=3133420 RepID=UPI0030C16FBC
MKLNKTLTRLTAAALISFAVASAPAALAQSKKEPFAYVEQMPKFQGGDKALLEFLGSNIKYPAEARNFGLEGLVVVSFVVETDGTITGVQPLKKLGKGTDEEAIRVVQLMSGKWTAGMQNDKPVRVKYTLPIRFALSESERASTAAVANQMPKYKGGQDAMLKAMSNHLTLPAEAKQENLNARVNIKFYVDKEGNVSNIRLDGTKLKKTVGPDSDLDYMDASTFSLQNKAILAKLSEAAVAAVKATSGNWEPALKNGAPMPSEIIMPVQFLGATAKATEQALPAPSMTKYTKPFYTSDEVDVKPTLQGGPLNKFLAKNLRYPKDMTFEGDFKTNIVIREDGSLLAPLMIVGQNISKEDEFLLFEELRRVFKLMEDKWTPGKVDGQPVSVTKSLTFRFVTNDGTKKPEAASDVKPDVVVTRYK